MPERSVRFGVADTDKRLRAASWKCFSGSTRDVYVACRELPGTLKLSLHESGRWHVAFDAQKFATMFEGTSPPSRFSGVWERPAPLVAGFTLACRIHTPWFAATIKERELEAGVKWLAPAPADQSVEVAIFLCDQIIDPNTWPGHTSMQTQPVGWYELAGGGCVWLVHKCVPALELKQPPMPTPNYFRGKSEAELFKPGTRAMFWANHSDGSIIWLETPVIVSKTEQS